ncbi:MAG: hypothetical protein Q7K45_05895 [Nanoarchaeota archaeon]|nr:hypothetical protein [Nanoarchaeota archaeon]
MAPQYLRKYLLSLALASSLLAPSISFADFYDGVRGPSKTQVHYTADMAGRNTQHSLALKYFGEKMFAVGAVNTDGDNINGEFMGVGYILEKYEQIKALPVLGYNLSRDGEQSTLVGIVQATLLVDKNGTFLLDPRYIVAVPAHGVENHILKHTFGLTISIGNAHVRVGADINYTLDQKVNEMALFRYDLDAEKHSSWIEFGMSRDGSVQLQFRGNF